MTAIVGIAHKGKVLIGGDSVGGAGTFAAVRSDRKVWSTGNFVFGFTTSFRMGQLLRYSLSIPPLKVGQTVDEYMVVDFVDAARTCLTTGGYATQQDGAEQGGSFLVGTSGRLFSIEDDYQVAEWAVGYHAIGSGNTVALGALHATEGQAPHDRIVKALEAAAEFSAFVRPPFVIETTI